MNGPEFGVELTRRASAVVVFVRGEVDVATAPALRTALATALRRGPAVLVVDLSAVRFLGAAGLSELVTAALTGGRRTAVRVVITRRECELPILLTDARTTLELRTSVEEAVRC